SNAMLGPVRQVANAIKSGQPVDALFLPAGREELPALAPLLASAELSSARVQFIGTGQWDYPNIGGDRALIGSWYPAPDPKGWSGFVQRYSKTYGAAPPRIASLGYDAISLAVSLSPNAPGQRYTTAQLTRPSGFSGIDGLFRLLSDGTSERGLAILEVREGGPQVIDPAPSSFATASSY
ncbi:MAG: penicillin-binding protein activator, partial [Methyloceanibacter sp.]